MAPGGKKVMLSSLLGKKAIAVPSPTVVPVRDELEDYLSSPLETDMDLDLLAYWKLKETTWPKLAKMAKQYLAAPFSSGGVDRVFSAAGKMHDDRPAQVGEGQHATARSLRHSTSVENADE